MKIETAAFSVETPSMMLEIANKYHDLCDAKNHFSETLVSAAPDFPLALYGSSVYGYCREGSHGKLNDLDMLSVVSRQYDFENILQTLILCGIENVQAQECAKNMFSEGAIDIVRISGRFEGHSCSVHVYAEDIVDLGYRATNVGMVTKNLVPNVPKYTHKENCVTTFQGKKIHCPVESQVINDSAITTGYFSRRVQGVPTLDIRADKFLSCEVVWDPMGKISVSQKKFWKNLVRAALFYQPGISDEDIIKMFGRYERFSNEYKQRLIAKIEQERDNLIRPH
jgi:hypothetical protein